MEQKRKVLGRSPLAEKFLRLFRSDTGLQGSVSLQEDNSSLIKNDHYDQKEIINFRLETELRKAKALMEWEKWQRRRFV